MSEKSNGIHDLTIEEAMVPPRLNLGLPKPVYEEIEQIAEAEDIKITDVVRQFVKMGLVAYRFQKDPNKRLIVEEDGKQSELILI